MSESTKKPTASAEETAATAPSDANTPQKPKRKLSRKAIIILAAVAAAIIIAIVVIVAVNAGHQENPDDEEVEYIDVKANNYYAGVIEPQQTSDVNKDPDRTVSTVYVKVGDTVKKGDKLFEYDSNETANKLAKAKIEYEGIQNDIAECDTGISQLSRQRSEAEDEAAKADFTTQIQAQESSKSQLQLSLKIKQVEIDNLQKNLDNSVVNAPIDGIIKQVNNTGSDKDDSASSSSGGAFITVLMNGAYRVKGQVDETNVRSLESGMNVVIHSRIDKDQTWKGTISKVDTSTNTDNGSGNHGGNTADVGSGDNTASKYNFYVTLDSSEGLLLGEHVFIEPVTENEAQNDAAPADNAQNAEN